MVTGESSNWIANLRCSVNPSEGGDRGIWRGTARGIGGLQELFAAPRRTKLNAAYLLFCMGSKQKPHIPLRSVSSRFQAGLFLK